MNPDDVVSIVGAAIQMVIMMAGPLLGASLLVGILVSLFQSVTQIQEQTLTFVPKFLTIVIALLLMLPWAIDKMVRYVTELFLSFHKFVG